MTKTATVQPALLPANETTAIDVQSVTVEIERYKPLLAQIEQAKEAAQSVTFDYADKKGNKAARSYLAPLRSLRVAVDNARKAEGAWAREYVKTVNERGNALVAEVTALIEPHERELQRIEDAEKARVAGHNLQLAKIAALGTHEGGLLLDEIAARQQQLQAFDPATFEEFEGKAAAEIVRVGRLLEQLHASETARLEAEAERQRLQAEAAELRRQEEIRQAAERLAALQLEQQRREAAAALEAERQATAAAEARAAEAERLAAQPAPAPAPIAYQQPAARPAAAPVAILELPPAVTAAPAVTSAAPAVSNQRTRLMTAIRVKIMRMSHAEIAAALADGTLHPALQVNWSQV